ncbi:hypothetical protein CU100_10610 [Phyllobacterium endophyticum]|uniref:Uncharacterized protein n=1 Tax=Phyllobacterium endophyticum TaxID=1149773 RepID=A0A2P7AVA2_9HYPH|nr:hypothetical protein CU100_10610 [Phyllobacterium endophyticum]
MVSLSNTEILDQSELRLFFDEIDFLDWRLKLRQFQIASILIRAIRIRYSTALWRTHTFSDA